MVELGRMGGGPAGGLGGYVYPGNQGRVGAGHQISLLQRKSTGAEFRTLGDSQTSERVLRNQALGMVLELGSPIQCGDTDETGIVVAMALWTSVMIGQNMMFNSKKD